MGRLFYYINQFSDETMPCPPALESWAAWLALPAAHEDVDGWGRPDHVEDGAEFRASVMEELEDLDVERTADGWRLSREVEPDASFFAIRYGRGKGWDIESMGDDLPYFLDCASESDAVEIGETAIVAVCRDRPDVMLRFTREPTPHCSIVGQVY